MEIDRYLEIQQLCNKDTYSFLHGIHVSPEDFKLPDFFDYILAERNIKYIEHRLSSKKIVGHYMRDELGKSIMINNSNDRITKNVGCVHEVGHDTLHLTTSLSQNFKDGIENLYSGTEQIEIEANTAAMMYYIPDISLYTAIIDPNMNYIEMLKLFNVPEWLLERRIIRFLQINCMMTFDDAEFLVYKYQGKSYYNRNSLLQEMVKIDVFEKKILREFETLSFLPKKQTHVPLLNKESYSLFKKGATKMILFDIFKKNTPQPTKSHSPIIREQNIDFFVENNLKGTELEKNGKIDEAIKLYENNVKNGFDGNHPYDRLAVIYRKRKDYNNEIRVLQSAINTFEKISSDRRDVAPKLLKFKNRLAKANELMNK